MNSRKKYFEVVDREVLINLMKLKTIDWYYFHKQYKLSPGQLSRSIKKLEAWKFLVIEEEQIRITEEGQKTIVSERNRIFRKNSDEDWGVEQRDRMRQKIEINQLYMPNIKKLKK